MRFSRTRPGIALPHTLAGVRAEQLWRNPLTLSYEELCAFCALFEMSLSAERRAASAAAGSDMAEGVTHERGGGAWGCAAKEPFSGCWKALDLSVVLSGGSATLHTSSGVGARRRRRAGVLSRGSSRCCEAGADVSSARVVGETSRRLRRLRPHHKARERACAAPAAPRRPPGPACRLRRPTTPASMPHALLRSNRSRA